MKTILATTYAVNPYKGSEDGMGWNFICQIAKNHQVIAITRKNNREAITQYCLESPNEIHQNIRFYYFDLPYWMRFWKRKEKGAMLYFFLWQLFLPLFVWMKGIQFDLAHNLNFHTDWIPTFLWLLGKPTVWGPIGHHPQLKKEFIQPFYGKSAYYKSQAKWWIKKLNWLLNPFLMLSVFFSKKIIIMSDKAADGLAIPDHKKMVMPSVGTSAPTRQHQAKKKHFQLLMVGRMVPLKGFDIAIESFACFYKQLPIKYQQEVSLHLVGKGPYRDKLMQQAQQLQIADAVQFTDWIEHAALSRLYQEASAFLFPSYEGAGMVVAEALSHGLPVICFNNCGPGTFVKVNCGIKVSTNKTRSESIHTFSESIRILFEHPELQAQLSRGAYTRFQHQFNWDRKGEKLQSLYDSLLKQSSTVYTPIILN